MELPKKYRSICQAIEPFLSPIEFRELLLALCQEKLARLILSTQAILKIGPILKNYNIPMAIGKLRIIQKADQGKGGWSNLIETVYQNDDKPGFYHIYISTQIEKIEVALEAEGNGEYDLFGEILNIPKCCRNAYGNYLHTILKKQNDVTPMTSHNTTSFPPHNFWANIASQYFGYSLLSFAPCSLNCQYSQKISQNTYKLLLKYDRIIAEKFFQMHQSNIIYHEYFGIHCLQNSLWKSNNILTYDPCKILSTSKSQLSTALRQGTCIKYLSQKSFYILNNTEVISAWCGDDVALFLCC